MKQTIVLGSRGSELALSQARMVQHRLREEWPGLDLQMKAIKTSGDETAADKPTAIPPAGRKGLFTAEIERALIAGTIDVAVHSAKDLPSVLGDETEIAAVLSRGRVEDFLVSANGFDLESLVQNATVATGSVRRQHQLRWKRPDLRIVDLRGNVPTRLRKLTVAGWDAAILAGAGLDRLGLGSEATIEFEGNRLRTSVLPSDVFVPAGGQGIIAMQIRSDDDRARKLVEATNHSDTRLCLGAEREFLRLLHGDCNQPVGVLAVVKGNMMNIHGQVFRSGESAPRAAGIEGTAEHGHRLAAELLQRINEQ